MPQISRPALLWLLSISLLACSTPPVITTLQPATPITAREAAAAPERYLDQEVIWGGMILALDNRETQTEVTVLAFPLDRQQRPLPQAPSQGRFIIVLPGYVEHHDYPDGLFVSLAGRLAGARAGHIHDSEYVFPLVTADHVHRWPPGYQFDRPDWHFHVGVGVHVR